MSEVSAEPSASADSTLEEAGPGLGELIRSLVTPARSGFALTRETIGRLGAELGLPTGVAGRERMLRHLFEAAAATGQLLALLELLDAEACRWRERYATWRLDYPRSAPVWGCWLGTLDSTRSLLSRMAQQAAESAEGR
ncbi:MAG: hypothetical protein IT307_14950 [Chloroflexi bacterium]|nr:hypothetical protein [Chloroflexota bacterium]